MVRHEMNQDLKVWEDEFLKKYRPNKFESLKKADELHFFSKEIKDLGDEIEERDALRGFMLVLFIPLMLPVGGFREPHFSLTPSPSWLDEPEIQRWNSWTLMMFELFAQISQTKYNRTEIMVSNEIQCQVCKLKKKKKTGSTHCDWGSEPGSKSKYKWKLSENIAAKDCFETYRSPALVSLTAQTPEESAVW